LNILGWMFSGRLLGESPASTGDRNGAGDGRESRKDKNAIAEGWQGVTIGIG
jgi:hypothetical protein